MSEKQPALKGKSSVSQSGALLFKVPKSCLSEKRTRKFDTTNRQSSEAAANVDWIKFNCKWGLVLAADLLFGLLYQMFYSFLLEALGDRKQQLYGLTHTVCLH